jgi:hypothetical protein
VATIVVIGDVGGCAGELADALASIDGEPDTVVIQVGDLIDRGPDSPGVLALVQERLDGKPTSWIQLVGNHESQYLGGEPFWPHRLADADADLLRGWWLKDRLRVAAALRTVRGEEFLVTHAGLTLGTWRKLGEPVTAGTAADLLNTRPEDLLWHEQGPLWADAGPHVYPSWLHGAQPMPFGQIHGHSSIVDFDHERWLCAERIRHRSAVDWTARHTFTRMPGTARFIGVDPRHRRTGAREWAPLVLRQATLIG